MEEDDRTMADLMTFPTHTKGRDGSDELGDGVLLQLREGRYRRKRESHGHHYWSQDPVSVQAEGSVLG